MCIRDRRKSNSDLLAAAKYAREGLRGSVWYRLLKDTFDLPRDRAASPSLALARAIWKLPSKLIVTTNYDQVLRWAQDQPDDFMQLNIDPAAELAMMLRGEV